MTRLCLKTIRFCGYNGLTSPSQLAVLAPSTGLEARRTTFQTKPRHHKVLCLVVTGFLLGAIPVQAETGRDSGVPFSPQKHLWGINVDQAGVKKTPDPVDTHHRAGHPQEVAWYAKPSRDPHDCGGYVGGGAVWKGHGRCPDEGTWGFDYSGLLIKKHIWLQWWHGRRDQDGGGAYATDGPHLLKH